MACIQSRMGKMLRYILLSILGVAILAAFFAMLFEPFFAALLVRFEIDSSSWVDPMLEVFANRWVHVILAGLLGATLGAWAHWGASKFDAPRDRIKTDADNQKRLLDSKDVGKRCCDLSEEMFRFLSERTDEQAIKSMEIDASNPRDTWQADRAFERQTGAKFFDRYGQRAFTLIGILKSYGIAMPSHLVSLSDIRPKGIPQVLSVFGGMLADGRLEDAISLSSDQSFLWSIQH